MKKFLIPLFTFTFALHLCGATNLVSNTAIVTNRVQSIVTYTMSNGVARVQDPSGKLVGTAEERALKVAAEGQADIASAAADAAGTAMDEWREFTATTDVKVCYIDAGFTQDLPALAPNLCGWVAGSFYDREKGEDHYYVWFNREIDYPPSMCARIVSESGTNWLDGAWVDWAVTNWIDKATGREFVMPTARDYVQDGLVAMWDGEWNEAVGVHNGELDGWNDLVGDLDFVLLNKRGGTSTTVIGENNYSNGSATPLCILENVALDEDFYKTCEIVFRPDSVNNGTQFRALFTPGRIGTIINGRQAYPCFGRYDASSPYLFSFNYFRVGGVVYRAGVPCSLGEIHSASGSFETMDSTIENDIWLDGVKYSTPDYDFTLKGLDPYTYLAIGGRTGNSGTSFTDSCGVAGAIYCVRLYGRVLTEAEVAANYAVDKARFMNDGPPVPCRELVVPRRNANCVLKTGTVITLGGKDGFDADIHKVNIEIGGTPSATTSQQLPLFYAVTRSGTNTITRAYTNGFINVENGFIKEPSNE